MTSKTTTTEDDGDIGKMYKDWGEEKKKKKESNKEKSMRILADSGIVDIISLNDGYHIKVDGGWDFWPSTGLFINQKLSVKGRGVRNFIKQLNKHK